jgi:DNA modification methylase
MITVNLDELVISPERQRKEFNAETIAELADSICSVGLIQPIVVRLEDGVYHLVAGERRVRAIKELEIMGEGFKHGNKTYASTNCPAVLFKDLTDLQAFEIELEENIRRVDISWQERATATARLYELRALQAKKLNLPEPTREKFAAEVYPDHHPAAASATVRGELLIARNLKDPEVAKASSRADAVKIIERKIAKESNRKHAAEVGQTFTAKAHALLQGDSLEYMKLIHSETFDCILTDPPYGIDAQEFNSSDGKAAGAHFYDDSYSTWKTIAKSLVVESYRFAKPMAHLYIFCDIDRFHELRTLASLAGWKPFRTPFVWHNPSSQRAPWPHSGPHRRYQLCLYAVKGDRPVLHLRPDVMEYKSDANLGHQAQKPVSLFVDLLQRTCRPGDTVLDPFCGSGTIFPAAHSLKVKATGIELDSAAYGLAAKRLGELK